MKKTTAMIMALMMVLTLTQCKKQEDNNGNNSDVQKVKVTCVVPMNNGGRSEFDNLMTDGTIKWSAGTERIYIAIPDETNPHIVELTAFTTLESNILNFEGEVAEGLIQAGEYDVYYLGNSKNLGTPYTSETIENEVITRINGSIANQSGSLEDLGHCHIAKTTATAEMSGEEIVLLLNGTLKNQIAIAHLDLADVTNLKGNAIVGTEYTLQYNNGKYEFSVTQNASANITITGGTTTSYVVLFPNDTDNVNLMSNTNKKITFEGGVEANKIYYKHISDVEYAPLIWEEDPYNGHEYVDLGLPSGLKWATCNVGATSADDYGDYFAWGETSPKAEYVLDTYLYWNDLDGDGLYDDGESINSDISGNTQYDAATANWGGSWRIPTEEEMQELVDNCTWEWTQVNGVKGSKVIGPNGSCIFLPAAGLRVWSSFIDAGRGGYYWSSTPSDYDDYDLSAYFLFFTDGNEYVGNHDRTIGFTVRPITE